MEVSGQLYAPATLPLLPRHQERPIVPFEQEDGCGPQPVRTIWNTEKSLAPVRIRTTDRPACSTVT